MSGEDLSVRCPYCRRRVRVGETHMCPEEPGYQFRVPSTIEVDWDL